MRIIQGSFELVRKESQLIGWFLDDWTIQVWKMVNVGLMDYRTKKTVRGFSDAHVHLDRCFTYKPEFFPPGVNLNEIADSPLSVKQDLIGMLHDGGAYSEQNLGERMNRQIERLIRAGTREIWAVVDTTPDIGLVALSVLEDLVRKHREKIDIHSGCYPVFGLKNPRIDSDRLNTLEEASERADFIMGLPEKDEAFGRIGFKGHVNLILDLGFRRKKEVHFHVDQGNTALQRDSFRVIECLEGLIPEKIEWFAQSGRPKLWLVHMISPSCYNGPKFSRLVGKLLRYNIGVICCPSAGISMREMRSENAPIHNSLARVLELLRSGVRVAIGTDNVNDMFVPSGSGLVLEEVRVLSNIVRNYSSHIAAKISMGLHLDNGDREILARALYEKSKAWHRHAEMIAEEERSNKVTFEY
jgi:cytosine/creatinine deaminase